MEGQNFTSFFWGGGFHFIPLFLITADTHFDHFGHIHLTGLTTGSQPNNNGNESLQKKRLNNKLIDKLVNYSVNIGSATHTLYVIVR